MQKGLWCFSSLALLASFCEVLFAEENVNIDYTILKSPEAAGFERQGRYNVGEYTGTANISIPLYNLKYKDLELPLSINYDSRGVKVDSEASWVGLNWDLNVGGCVSVIPSGGFDWCTTDYREQFENVLNYRNYNDYCYYSGLVGGIVTQYGNGSTELDFYSVSLPSATLYFFVDPETNEPTIIGKETGCFEIEPFMDNPGSIATNRISGWTIKDGDGYIYIFDAVEKSNLHMGEMYNSSWYLSEITSPTGNLMQFNYATQRIDLIPKRSESEEILLEIQTATNGATDYVFNRRAAFSNENHYVEKPYLTSIETDEHFVEFCLGNRIDISNGKRLDSIVVKSKLTDDIVRRIRFDHDYFTSNTVGGDYLENKFSISQNCLSKRLKLRSVVFSANGEKDQVYSFDYEENKGFPLKTSCAVDMWGYYNGQENSYPETQANTMIPCLKYCDIDWDIIRTHTGRGKANRFANPQKSDALILKKITYPTKGYTNFQYEPNTFRKLYKNKLASGAYCNIDTLEWSVIDSNVTGCNDHQVITIDKRLVGTLSVVLEAYGGQNLEILQPGTSLYVRLYRIGPESNEGPDYSVVFNTPSFSIYGTNAYHINQEVDLPAGSYMFAASLPNAVGSGKGYISGKLKVSPFLDMTPEVVETKGAGLRVKRIDNYDSDGTMLESTEYEYVNSDGTSSGLHINPSAFDRIRILTSKRADSQHSSAAVYKILCINSSAQRMTTFASVMSPNDVGYSRVKKIFHAKDGTTKEVSYFQNCPLVCNLDSTLCSVVMKDNGNLQAKEYYDKDDNLIRDEQYYYNSPSYTYFKKSFSLEDTYCFSGSDASTFDALTELLSRYRITCYSFRRFCNYLVTSIVTDHKKGLYDQMYMTLRNHTAYTYDSINHQVSSITNTVLGSNIRHKTDYLYTSKDSSSMSMQMVSNGHIYNALVQKTESVFFGEAPNIIKNQRNIYQNVNGYYRLSSTMTSVGSESLEERMRYWYNSYGNIKHVVKDDAENIVYLWSYKGLYPVARIEGLSYTDVETILTQSFISALETKNEPSAEDWNKIRNELSDAGGLVTAYTYRPSVGITSQIQPDGLTTKYEYDAFGQLRTIKDTNDNILSTYRYHYKE